MCVFVCVCVCLCACVFMCVCGLISLLAVGWVLSVTNAAPTFGMSSFSLRFQLTTVQFCHYGQFEHYRDSCDHT